MQTPEELEADVIRRAFDEKLLTELLHAYRDLAVEAERFAAQAALARDPEQIPTEVVHALLRAERERSIALCDQEARRYGAMDAPDQAHADFLSGAQSAALILANLISGQ